MKNELAAVVLGKKSWPSQGTSRNADGAGRQKHGTKMRAAFEPAVSAVMLVASAKSLESAFEGLLEARTTDSCVEVAAMPLLLSRYMASVGTSVREKMYDASIANTTASASGTNRYRATPLRKNIGRNTMQMHSVETNAGTAICAAPSQNGVCDFHAPLQSSARCFRSRRLHRPRECPTASANPPRVMMLMVSRRKLSTMTEVRIDSGMETAMISVLRQLPRKIRIISRSGRRR